MNEPKSEWADSGECTQWIPREVIRKNHDQLIYRGIFRPFTANGECWQITGIYGSFNKKDAIKILDRIAEWNPEHRYRVCELNLKQETKTIAEMKFEATVA